MSDELDDLLGTPQRPLKPARQRRARNADNDPNLTKLADGDLPATAEFKRPVGVTFLATIFDMTPAAVAKKLKGCEIIGWHDLGRHKNQPLYDFKEAVAYLIPPKIDIAQWIRSQNAATLPNHINKTFWEAMNARQRFLVKARQLWHDEDVLEVLGRTAMMIREETRLWIENLPGKADMTDEQYNSLSRNVSELLEQIHERLEVMPRDFATRPQEATMEAELEEAGLGDVDA